MCVLSCPVMSNSLWPHWQDVAHQVPLSMGILQARILKWVAMPSSRGSSQPRDLIQVTRIAGGFFTIWATRAAQWLILPYIWDLLRKTQCMQLDNWAKFQGSQSYLLILLIFLFWTLAFLPVNYTDPQEWPVYSYPNLPKAALNQGYTPKLTSNVETVHVWSILLFSELC